MNKRGQFYLFTAIILILVVFAISAQPNRLEEKVLLEDFNSLSKNYANEAPRVVNDALKNDKNPVENLGIYTDKFIDYAHTIDPNLGIVSVYNDPVTNQISVNNAGSGNTISVRDLNDDTTNLFPSSAQTINDISLDIGNQQYKKNVPTKMEYFEGMTTTSSDKGIKNLEIGGVLYPVSKDSTLTIIATSRDNSNPNNPSETKKVDIIKQ